MTHQKSRRIFNSVNNTMAAIRIIPLLGCALSLLGQFATANPAPKDLHEECEEWAARGDCKPNGRP